MKIIPFCENDLYGNIHLSKKGYEITTIRQHKVGHFKDCYSDKGKIGSKETSIKHKKFRPMKIL